MMDGFKKVAQTGGSYVVATFYNPDTNEVKTKCVRDYDYADCSRDDDELYNMPIDEDAKVAYCHSLGVILVGDMARVVKGRTIEHGFVGEVIDKRDYKDRYGRFVAEYIYFNDGRKININNCELV